ncbi:DNA adenine methylase [Thauera sinica]|uniref:site-specific DNA-methyltransferase (adenine-specific) n=1 Tax=Thauera sinica TaxID=2665146 RepID=A0ABW1ARC7_9RHOO|nr:DNA adenine methylase [Thauera sp. K11]ATE60180.1 restriction endonuclease subunit M [Thauera sp. K11]
MSNSKPVIPWIGGKRRLAKHILPVLPAHTCYVEPFAGAAAIYFLKEPAKAEVLNDVNGDLVNLYRVLKHHLDEFVRQFRWSLVSRQMFEWARLSVPDTLTDIQRAARFFYLQKLGFGGRVGSRTFGTATTAGVRLNLLRIEEELSSAHLRLSRTTIEHLQWQECVERYDRPHTLFYCDPPYYGTEGYGVEFGLGQYDQLAEVARTTAGKMLISVNDIPKMRAAFAGLTMDRLEISYTVSGSGGRKKSGELLIRNW